MKFRSHVENEMDIDEILNQVSRCKSDELETLLKQIESKIEISEEKNGDLLSAKTMITSRLASRRSK